MYDWHKDPCQKKDVETGRAGLRFKPSGMMQVCSQSVMVFKE